MTPGLYSFVRGDMLPMLAGVLAALSCGLLGNFLVLRRQSMMGDAISHAVLPGLVAAFVLTQSRAPVPMFVGAAVAGVLTVALIEVVKRVGRVEPGAAMGVVFSVMFALGVVLIERAARHIDLDADCVLHGQLEMLFWMPARDWGGFVSGETLGLVPRQVWTLLVVAVLTAGFVSVLFKELRIASFDAALATSLGFHAGWLHGVLMVFVAMATVAAFEAVGSILVIAMLICPAATARLLTDRLAIQVWLSAVIAVATSAGGYVLATRGYAWVGLSDAVSSAGMMTVVAGAVFALAVVASPSRGLIVRAVRRRRLGDRVLLEDLLGALWRGSERGEGELSHAALSKRVGESRFERAFALAQRARFVMIETTGLIGLTDSGRQRAAGLVRRHRLWESYLHDEAGLGADHVHEPAHRLEHFGEEPEAHGDVDPHGREIPVVAKDE